MSIARRRALPWLLFLLLSGCTRGENGSEDGLGARNQRPPLLLLTSLPIAFGESFSIEATGSPVLEALEQRYEVRPIATASAEALQGAKLLLMAQPLAQPAEDLVALDRWVRSGGRVLLLADPLLEWRDSRPLGDPTRPPPMFTDTGLLGHWGLRLDAPEQRGERGTDVGGQSISALSPGALQGSCELSADRIVAKCRVGKGVALIVADADFLDWSRGDQGESGLRALVAALDALERE